ncbi:MAG: YhcH/YjgK/YiaL family protein [Pseudomonadota bacterium]
MILDTLDNSHRYTSLHPMFERAFDYLRHLPVQPPESGRINLLGEHLVAIYSAVQGRTRDAAQLECHRRYIDIQYVIAGCDEMGWAPLQACHNPVAAFNSEKDIQFFHDAPHSWVTAHAGSFCIFFPDDAHAPLVSDGLIHKVVLKIEV